MYKQSLYSSYGRAYNFYTGYPRFDPRPEQIFYKNKDNDTIQWHYTVCAGCQRQPDDSRRFGIAKVKLIPVGPTHVEPSLVARMSQQSFKDALAAAAEEAAEEDDFFEEDEDWDDDEDEGHVAKQKPVLDEATQEALTYEPNTTSRCHWAFNCNLIKNHYIF